MVQPESFRNMFPVLSGDAFHYEVYGVAALDERFRQGKDDAFRAATF